MDEHEADAHPLEEERNDGAESDLLPPITVWFVSRETGQSGWEGTLELTSEALVFRPGGGAPRAFRLAEIKKAHRVLGSPVLELRMTPSAAQRLVGFYFVRPPNLEPPRSTTPRPLQKRNARKKAVLTLRAANEKKRDDIRVWVEAIRRGMASRRESG